MVIPKSVIIPNFETFQNLEPLETTILSPFLIHPNSSIKKIFTYLSKR